MECAFDTRPVVIAKLAYLLDNVFQVLMGDFVVGQRHVTGHEPGLRRPSQVQDNFQQFVQAVPLMQRIDHSLRQNVQKQLEFLTDHISYDYQPYASTATIPGLATGTATVLIMTL